MVGSAVMNFPCFFASAMIVESILSFLGAGTPPTIPSWGNMLADAANGSLYLIAWWMVVVPGTALLALTLSFNLLGDALRDLLDPRRRT